MGTTIDIFDRRSMTAAINNVKVVDPFITGLIWGNNIETHPTDKIDIEIFTSPIRLPKFVNEGEGARLIGKKGSSVKTISIPRTFEKKVFSAVELSKFKFLGNIWIENATELTSRTNQMILDEVSDLKNRITNLREWLACQALFTGVVSVAQDNINFSLDYEYVSNTTLALGANVFTLSSDDEWDKTTSNPFFDIRNWKRLIQQRTGLVANTLILGSEASEAFLTNQKVMDALDNLNYKAGTASIINSNNSPTTNIIYTAPGLTIYEYSQQYTNDSDQQVELCDPKSATMVATQSSGFRTHVGPLYRIENGNLRVYQTDMLVETLTNEDKTALDWKVEQKSLPAIHQPLAVITGTVIG